MASPSNTVTAACPFCAIDPADVIDQNDHAVAIRDRFPVSPGHTLVLPRVHVASIFDTDAPARDSVWSLVARVRDAICRDLQPDGFNVGVNDGAAAGQTIMHAHVHVIPRFKGDRADPRGGVRWILQERAAYWTAPHA